MRKITKSLLALALLFGAVGGAKAEKVYADLSQYGDKWDGTDVSFSWTATYSNQLTPNLTDNNVGLPKGDLRSWEKLVVVVDELTNCDFFRVLVYSGDDSNHSNTFKVTVTGKNEFTLSGNVDFLNNVTKIVLSGSNWEDSKKETWAETPASFKVKEVYLERPDIVYIEASEVYEAPAGTTDIKNLTGYTDNSAWANSVVYPKELAVQGQAFGNGDGSSESEHVNIDGYDYICFNVTTATTNTAGLRVWIWDDVNSAVVTLYAKPIADYATATWTEASKITAVGTYVAKVSGYKYLKGVKAANDWGSSPSKVSMAWMCKGEVPVDYASTGQYALVGEATGSATLTDALDDASATSYDATGVTGTGVDLTGAANPNALFIANEGVLANASNVIVSSACAQLALTDGYPFKAPAAFTATAAPTYDRVFTASTTTTVCLPFALTAAEAATLGTFYELSSIDGTTLHFTSVDAPEANKAYLVVPTAAGLTLSETAKAIAATPADLGTTVSDVSFIGTLAAFTFPASDAAYSYYAYNNGSLVKVTAAATLPAFRGYFKVAGASARSLNISLDNETTGISTSLMNNGKVNNKVYNLKGQRVSQPTKGLYIVNGKKIVK